MNEPDGHSSTMKKIEEKQEEVQNRRREREAKKKREATKKQKAEAAAAAGSGAPKAGDDTGDGAGDGTGDGTTPATNSTAPEYQTANIPPPPLPPLPFTDRVELRDPYEVAEVCAAGGRLFTDGDFPPIASSLYITGQPFSHQGGGLPSLIPQLALNYECELSLCLPLCAPLGCILMSVPFIVWHRNGTLRAPPFWCDRS